MAYSYLLFDDQKQHGRLLRRMLQQLEESHDILDKILTIMAQMLDGDGTQDVHYAYITSRFGFESDAKSRQAYTDLTTLASKFSGNGSVTNTKATLTTAYARFG